MNSDCAGRDADTLLSMIGAEAPGNVRCIVFEGEKEHPLISEMLMVPVLGIVRTENFKDALEQAVWLEGGNHLCACIHSRNAEHITAFAEQMDTAVLIRNSPSFAGPGLSSQGSASFTIANRTGEGCTSAGTFVKKRRVVMADMPCIY